MVNCMNNEGDYCIPPIPGISVVNENREPTDFVRRFACKGTQNLHGSKVSLVSEGTIRRALFFTI
jgi:hypothetical protein